MLSTESKKSEFGDFRPELLGNAKRTVSQCVIQHIGHHGFNPAWKKLGYALPMRTDYEETQNLKKHNVKDCPYHANKDKILKRINELKSNHKLFSMKSETDDGLSSCSSFPERPSSYELDSDKPVFKTRHLKGKIGEGYFEKLRDVLNWNADVFPIHKADIGCCNFVEHEIELEEGAVPHRDAR